jgi:hypothetical protein
MPRLFSYTIPIDDGAAPNPFHGVCTLAICKPTIRRVAAVDDWVVGLGSSSAPSGDLSGRVVYAMRVTLTLPFEEYDRRAPMEWPAKIPDTNSHDLAARLGDCIYDFSQSSRSGSPALRASVHGIHNMDADLGGRNVLISDDFYYFGSRAIPLPSDLLPICHQMQGHKSDANRPYFSEFVRWIRQCGAYSGQLNGWPDTVVGWPPGPRESGCNVRARESVNDPVC